MISNSIPFKITLFLSLLILFAAEYTTSAQETGGLRGQVTDPDASLVVNAEVALVNNKGVAAKTKTDSAGVYSFRSQLPGLYTLTVEAKDFAPFIYKEISVSAGVLKVFDVRLSIKTIDVNVDTGLGTDANENLSNPGGEVVLTGRAVDQLPDDPDALAAALKAMALSGPGEPQIYVDDFPSGKPPPKQSIREVRISQNYMSAEEERPGGSRINIFTKVGENKLQGSAYFNWSDQALNTRNPLAQETSPYKFRQYGFFLSRAIVPKKAAFTFSFGKTDEDRSGVVSAETLDPGFNIVPLRFSSTIPRRGLSLTPRFDYQINPNNTLVLRYLFDRTKIRGLGVGELSLSGRAYDLEDTNHTFRVAETAVLNTQTVNEFRFQILREDLNIRSHNSSPSINVQDAFLGGGSPQGNSNNTITRFEVQNYTTVTTLDHITKFGLKLRSIDAENNSTENFNGSYTFTGHNVPVLDSNNQIILDGSGQPILVPFTSLEVYRRTLVLQSLGFGPADIRLRGGGASQFSITRGNDSYNASFTDIGAFIQDEWRVKPNFNLYLGLRYEWQTGIDDNSSLGPRIAFAWAPKFGKEQRTTLRGGIGYYYERVNESYFLLANKFDGLTQQRFVSSDPALADFFPNIPTDSALAGFSGRQAISTLNEDLLAGKVFLSLFSLEHKISKTVTLYSGLSTFWSSRLPRQRNINAPLPGTFVVGQPGSGIRPFGNTGELFLIESTRRSFTNQLYTNLRAKIIPTVSLSFQYTLTDAKEEGEQGGFPSDSYNSRDDWGRASYVLGSRHRLNVTGTIEIPKAKLVLTPMVVFFSSRPFNIVSGIDINGDQIYNDRPSFSPVGGGPNIVQTEFGTFNLLPQPGEPRIPRNFGRGPSFFSVNMGISRTFGFGKAEKNSSKPYKLGLSAQIQNLFNNTNLATPIGNLSSPLFGRSTTIVGAYGWIEDDPAFNRKVTMQLSFNF